MVGSVTNDKILPQERGRSSAAENRRSGEQSATTGEKAAEKAAAPADDSVEVSSAGRMFSQETESANRPTRLQNADQASQLAAQVRQQIEAAGARALAAQGGVQADQLSGLLEASPA